MKKFTTILSLVAIVASALFVTSCAQKKQPTLVPAFPYNKTATYTQNEDTMEWAWSYASADAYSNAKGGGFEASKLDPTYLEYRIAPNADWSLEIVGNGKQYVEAYLWDGHFKVEDYTFGSTLSGKKGMNEVGFRVIKTPESYEEPVEVEVALTMEGETMVIATLVLEPAVF
jgi:hypothetical protein